MLFLDETRHDVSERNGGSQVAIVLALDADRFHYHREREHPVFPKCLFSLSQSQHQRGPNAVLARLIPICPTSTLSHLASAGIAISPPARMQSRNKHLHFPFSDPIDPIGTDLGR